MDNYPPGAKDDPKAPYNEVEYAHIDIYTLGDMCIYIYVNSEEDQLTLDGYDIYNNLFPKEFEDDGFKSAKRIRGGVEITTIENQKFIVGDDEIISYFYTKFQ